MEKLVCFFILALVVLSGFQCGTSQVGDESILESLHAAGIKELPAYVNELRANVTSEPIVVEMRVSKEDDQYVYAEMFLSKPYLEGEKLPVSVSVSQASADSVFFLLYHTSSYLTKADSISMTKKLGSYNLVVDDILDWTKYGDWSTHDYDYLTFIFCREDMSIYTITKRAEKNVGGLPLPDC